MAAGYQAVRGALLSTLHLLYHQDKFVQLLIQFVREILQLSGKSQGIPETSGCSNHVKVPLWSTLLLCMA